MSRHTERSTTAACIATVVGAPTVEVPLDDEERRAWLAGRGLGLVPIADAAAFAWPGPWIARRPARDGSGPRAVVMFGVPSGPIWDPADTTDEVLDGWVVAALDVSVWEPPAARDPGVGVVEEIVIAPVATAPVVSVPSVEALPGVGLRGDRYEVDAGTFRSFRPGTALTLVSADVLDDLNAERSSPVDHRRNLVVRGMDLNALVGRRFTVGGVLCAGSRLCEPCVHLEKLNDRSGILRPMVHRGGLRADVLEAGTIRVGDEVVPLAPSG